MQSGGKRFRSYLDSCIFSRIGRENMPCRKSRLHRENREKLPPGRSLDFFIWWMMLAIALGCLIFTTHIYIISSAELSGYSMKNSLVTYLAEYNIIFPSSLLNPPTQVEDLENFISIETYSGKKVREFSVRIDPNSKRFIINEDFENNDTLSKVVKILLQGREGCLFENEYKEQEEMVDWITTCGEKIAALPRRKIHDFNLLHRGIGALLVHQDSQKLFVHQRAATKRLFPSMFDMFIGGVCQSKIDENPVQTLLREVEEECNVNLQIPETIPLDQNLDGEEDRLIKLRSQLSNCKDDQKLPSKILETLSSRQDEFQKKKEGQFSYIKYLGDTIIRTTYNACLVHVYEVILSAKQANNIRFRDNEIVSGNWMSLQELNYMIAQQEHVFVPDGMQVWRAVNNELKQGNQFVKFL
jgi:isopentenyldiphosphate isomerase